MIYIEFIFVYGVRNWSRMGQGSPGHAVPGLPWGDGYSWCGPGQCGTIRIVFLGISNSGENSSSSLPTWHPFTMVNKWTWCTCSSEAFKLTVFHCFPGWLSLHTSPSAISLPPAGWRLRDRVPIDIISLSLLPISMCFLYLALCKSCSISPQLFFRSNCSLHRCRFGVSLGGDEFNTFLHCHLGPKPNLLFIHFSIYSKCQHHISYKKMVLTTFH